MNLPSNLYINIFQNFRAFLPKFHLPNQLQNTSIFRLLRRTKILRRKIRKLIEQLFFGLFRSPSIKPFSDVPRDCFFVIGKQPDEKNHNRNSDEEISRRFCKAQNKRQNYQSNGNDDFNHAVNLKRHEPNHAFRKIRGQSQKQVNDG